MGAAAEYACRMQRLGRAFWGILIVVACACSPQQPSVTPQSVQITGVGVQGVRLRANLNAYNPNDYGLTIQAVSGRIVLDNSVPLGSAQSQTSVYLPANGWQQFFVDLELPWLNLPAALAVARARQQVPYTFEGNATVGGTISITVPIRMQGSIAAQELLRASTGLPRLGAARPVSLTGTLALQPRP